MKKTITTALTLVLGSTLLFSCETCDNPTVTQLNQQDIDWLVYEEKSEEKFLNEKGDTIEYKFGGALAQTVAGEGYSTSDECIDKLDTQAFMYLQDESKKNDSFITYILKRPHNLILKIGVDGRGDWTIDKDKPTYPEYEVGDRTFINVYEILPDSTKPTSVKRILFNKGYGFLYVGYYNGKSLQIL